MVRAIVGGCWGDEGKGKMTDRFAAEADFVVRFQGGANAGHTIVNEYGRFALHLLPSGVFHPGVVNVLGPGVALDPAKLFRELDGLAERGVPAPDLRFSDRAPLLLPWHVRQDDWEEAHLGAAAFGSTRTGIAPFYADKAMKIGLTVSDLFEDDWLLARLETICEHRNRLLGGLYGAPPTDPGELARWLAPYRARLAPLACDTTALLHAALGEDRRILLEGQLGALKDPDHGIQPFTTSSSPLAGFASVGAGLPPHAIREVVTVVKAYASCVGAGPFVSELSGAAAEALRERGGDRGEYGATTGRPRRVGWFDCVAARYGCRLQGTTAVALSVLDALGYLDEIPVCTGYRIDGTVTRDFPAARLLARAEPVLEVLPGWGCDIRGIRRFEDLPAPARRYVRFLEEQTGFPIGWISNGPEREALIPMM